MTARELTVSCVTEAPVEAVWAVLTDVEGAPRVLRGVSRVEVLAGDGYAVGTRWRETRRVLGREETQTMEVAACDPPHRTVVVAKDRGVDFRTVFTLEPHEKGTRIELCFGATHPDPTMLHRLTVAVFGRVGEALTRKVLQQDLEDIAAAASR